MIPRLLRLLPLPSPLPALGPAPAGAASPGAEPAAAQKNFLDLKFALFLRFNPVAFTDVEWTNGGEDPATFRPDRDGLISGPRPERPKEIGKLRNNPRFAHYAFLPSPACRRGAGGEAKGRRGGVSLPAGAPLVSEPHSPLHHREFVLYYAVPFPFPTPSERNHPCPYPNVSARASC
jgi:hypothetical protein